MASQSLKIPAIVGPTASGKTAFAVALARRTPSEIISADSRQIYKKLDAGTAKPGGRWQGEEYVYEGIVHHLIDVIDPSEKIDAGRYAELATEAIDHVRAKKKQPILAGGTGLYFRAVLEGLDPMPKRDPAIRERLAELAETAGPEILHERLQKVDPGAAARIPARNVHRVVRALEVFELSGKPISEHWTGRKPERYPAVYVGISWTLADLSERIDARCRSMFPNIVKEVKALVPAAYSGTEPGFQSLGYPEALACLRGEMTEARAVEAMIQSTKAYAKRQATWFRKQTNVHWIPAGERDPETWADQAEEILSNA